MIKNKRKIDQCFSFGPVYMTIWQHMWLNTKEMNNLDIVKASQQSDIPAMFLKQSSVLQNTFVEISTSVFRNQCPHQIWN